MPLKKGERPNPLTDAEKATIRQFAATNTVQHIAERIKRGVPCVRKFMQREGLIDPPRMRKRKEPVLADEQLIVDEELQQIMVAVDALNTLPVDAVRRAMNYMKERLLPNDQ